MQRRLRDRPLSALVAGVVAALVPAAVELAVGRSTVDISATIHFYAVGMTALVAAGAAVTLTVIGARFNDTRTVLTGTAFAVMAALLALHGISTPGVLFPSSHYGEVMLTGGATLPAGAAILALSAIRLPRFLQGVRPLLVLQAVLLTVIVGLGTVGLFYPAILPEVPEANSPPALTILAAGLLLFVVLATRAGRTYLLTRRIPDLIVLVGIVWLGT